MTGAVVTAVLLVSSAGSSVRAETPEAAFQRANASYEAGDYEEAIAAYSELVQAGVAAPSLYYNLGNAYYKVGALGHAVLFYERARRLAPRDDDVATNLALVRSLLRDRQFIDKRGWLRQGVTWPRDQLSTRETFLLATIWYLVLTLALLGLIFRDSKVVAAIYPKLSMASPGRLIGLSKQQDFAMAVCTTCLLFGVTAVSAAAKYRTDAARPVGVVLSEEAAVHGGPSDDTTLQFKIHEGTLVRIDDSRRGWVQIRLPGGLSGWIRSGAVERI